MYMIFELSVFGLSVLWLSGSIALSFTDLVSQEHCITVSLQKGDKGDH